jgi:hypothetical protein
VPQGVVSSDGNVMLLPETGMESVIGRKASLSSESFVISFANSVGTRKPPSVPTFSFEYVAPGVARRCAGARPRSAADAGSRRTRAREVAEVLEAALRVVLDVGLGGRGSLPISTITRECLDQRLKRLMSASRPLIGRQVSSIAFFCSAVS